MDGRRRDSIRGGEGGAWQLPPPVSPTDLFGTADWADAPPPPAPQRQPLAVRRCCTLLLPPPAAVVAAAALGALSAFEYPHTSV